MLLPPRASIVQAPANRAWSSHPRHVVVDALRGAAMVWMTVFHFCFDLAAFGLMGWDFYRDPFWLHQRTVIVSLFLLCAGMGQALAWQAGQTPSRFWRRWGQVAAGAALVSLASWLWQPGSWIWFGVLHGMAVMLLIVRVLAPRLGAPALLALAAVAIALPWIVSHPAFDSRALGWIGLVTRKPVTQDFVPVLPWLGVMLVGVALGRTVGRSRPSWLDAGAARPLVRALAALGRWPLSYYLLHQPVLIGVLMLALAR